MMEEGGAPAAEAAAPTAEVGRRLLQAALASQSQPNEMAAGAPAPEAEGAAVAAPMAEGGRKLLQAALAA